MSLAKAAKDYYLRKLGEISPGEDYYLRGWYRHRPVARQRRQRVGLRGHRER